MGAGRGPGCGRLLVCLLCCRSGASQEQDQGVARSKNPHHYISLPTVNCNFAPSRSFICRFCPCSVANRAKKWIYFFVVTLVGRVLRGKHPLQTARATTALATADLPGNSGFDLEYRCNLYLFGYSLTLYRASATHSEMGRIRRVRR